jgi:hypothetical protein
MQPLSKAVMKLFGIQYLLCFLVLLLEMSFAQFLCAGTVSELDLGLTAKGASPLTAAEALRSKMAEELDLGIGPDLIAKHGGGGGGGGRGRGGWDRSFAQAQADLRKHEAAEAKDQADTDRQMAEAEAMIADAQRDLGGRVRSRGSRSTPAMSNQTRNVVPGLHNPKEGPHVRTGAGQTATTTGGTPRSNAQAIRDVGVFVSSLIDSVALGDRIRWEERTKAERERLEGESDEINDLIGLGEILVRALTDNVDKWVRTISTLEVMDKTWEATTAPPAGRRNRSSNPEVEKLQANVDRFRTLIKQKKAEIEELKARRTAVEQRIADLVNH